ncbi:YpbF family protein [Bacillus sp. CGMCC 1.16607]|uniref:YpbF family protein n=1 Tax=Bacillus sp. CGMCC 1.16607 TaxID=3351842 RepID=UPI00363F6C52
MEQSILLLDEKTDNAAKQMLENVVKRKKKFDDFKFNHNLSIMITLGFSFIFLVYLYKTVVIPYSYSFMAMFSVFFQKEINLFFLVITIGMYGMMTLLKAKREKAEKEYHALRCEIVDRSKDLWKKEEEWKSRHKVFEMMKEKYDINLFHESK